MNGRDLDCVAANVWLRSADVASLYGTEELQAGVISALREN
jgi:hypothetical protein